MDSLKFNDIYQEDCLEGMRKLPDGCIDLVVTDPPYLFEKRGTGLHKKYDYFDKIKDKNMSLGYNEYYLDEMLRVLRKVNIYIFCNKNQLGWYFDYFKKYHCDILIWHKTNPIPIVNNKYLSDVEYIFFAREKGAKLYGSYETKSKVYTSKVNREDLKKYGHPTIKPLPLIERIITNSSLEGGTILDPFMGSGTTAVACIKNRRDYIGFEINEEYYKTAQQRIQTAKSELTLF